MDLCLQGGQDRQRLVSEQTCFEQETLQQDRRCLRKLQPRQQRLQQRARLYGLAWLASGRTSSRFCSALIAPVSVHVPLQVSEYDEFSDDGLISRYGHPLPPMHNPRHQSAFYTGNLNHCHLFESEPAVRRGFSCPTAAQTDELRSCTVRIRIHSRKKGKSSGLELERMYQCSPSCAQ